MDVNDLYSIGELARRTVARVNGEAGMPTLQPVVRWLTAALTAHSTANE